MRTFSILGLTAGLLAASLAGAADWPQWLGPKRDGHSPEKGLLKTWPKDGPKLLWTYENTGTGYSCPAVVDGIVYTMGARDKTEYVFALDGKGAKPKELWAVKIGPMYDYKGNVWVNGPNATPTVDEDSVYALGSQGILVCVDRKTGAERWRKDFPKDLDAVIGDIGGSPKKMGWGYCWSPLLDGEQLICVPGGPKGLLAALNRKTGAVLWRSKDVKADATYSSPIVAEIGGTRQYMQVTQEGLVGVDTKGALLWSYKRSNPWPDVVCDTPLHKGDFIYTSEWGGAVLLNLEKADGKFKPKKVYAQSHIGNHHGGVILVEGSVYGYHELRSWECQGFTTGKIVKKLPAGRAGLSMGAPIFVDGRLYALCDNAGPGIVALLNPSPTAFKVISRFKLPKASAKRKLRGGVWTPPVIADGHLYLRDQELLFCYGI
jgi:outer membrane protein assembly factor BamB